MHDAHFHISDHLFREFKKHQMKGICNISSPDEWTMSQKYLDDYPFKRSVGIHPWKADQTSFDEMLPLLEQADFIGEIGLDSIWCNVDPDIQKQVFKKQLQLASDLKKPVILHIKNMEKDALPYIKKYPNIYVSHWYSCKKHLEEYDEVIDYFTVGPSVGTDEAVNNVAKKIDIHKLLLESDGMEAIKWAVNSSDYISTLENSLKIIREVKNTDADIKDLLDKNFNNLLQFTQKPDTL